MDLLPAGAPDAPEGHLCRGTALALLERYQEAEAAYAAGLAEQPTHERLQQLLQQLRAALADGQMGGGEQEGGVRTGGGGSTSEAAGGAGGVQRQGQAARRLQEVTDDTECTLCMRMFYDPGERVSSLKWAYTAVVVRLRLIPATPLLPTIDCRFPALLPRCSAAPQLTHPIAFPLPPTARMLCSDHPLRPHVLQAVLCARLGPQHFALPHVPHGEPVCRGAMQLSWKVLCNRPGSWP